MRSGRRIKVSVPLQRFQPLRILKVKGKKKKNSKNVYLNVYILMYVLMLTITIIEW